GHVREADHRTRPVPFHQQHASDAGRRGPGRLGGREERAQQADPLPPDPVGQPAVEAVPQRPPARLAESQDQLRQVAGGAGEGIRVPGGDDARGARAGGDGGGGGAGHSGGGGVGAGGGGLARGGGGPPAARS